MVVRGYGLCFHLLVVFSSRFRYRVVLAHPFPVLADPGIGAYDYCQLQLAGLSTDERGQEHILVWKLVSPSGCAANMTLYRSLALMRKG